MKTWSVILTSLLLTFPSLAQWEPTNGPYGGIISSIHEEGDLLYATTYDEVYVSSDSGSNWTSISEGLPDFLNRIWDFAVQDTLMFLGTSKIDALVYRAGTTSCQWEVSQNGLPKYAYVSSVATFSDNVFLATTHGIYRSDDYGDNWITCHPGLTDTTVTVLMPLEERLYTGTYHGNIFYIENIGAGWTQMTTGGLPEDCFIHCLAIQDSLLFAGTSMGMFRTANEGISWDSCSSGITDQYIVDIAMDELYTYAGTRTGGVFRSVDFGETWQPASTGLNYTPLNALEEAFGDLYTGIQGGVFKSTDHGDSWSDCNNGLYLTSVGGIQQKDEVLLAATWLGVFRSFDYGNSWAVSNSGLTVPWVRCFTTKDSMVFAGTGEGIFRSDDLGETWISVSNGLVNSTVTEFGVKGELLFAGTGDGLYRSNNNGGYWTNVLPGYYTIFSVEINGSKIFAASSQKIFLSEDNGNTWTVATDGYLNASAKLLATKDSIIYAASEYVYRSAIDTVYWEITGNGSSQVPQWVYALQITDSTLFAGVNESVWVTNNQGEEWFDVGEGFDPFLFIHDLQTIDQDLYAATRRGVWKRALSEMYVMEFQPDTILLAYTVNSTADLFIRSNTGWSIEGEIPDWLEVEHLSGSGTDTIGFHTKEPNPDTLSRSVTFLLTSDRVEPQSFTVMQEGFHGFLSIDPDSLFLGYQSGSRDTLYIQSNTEWIITGSFPLWLSATKVSGSGTDSVIFTTLQDNPLELTRSTIFGIESDFTPIIGLDVLQQGKPAGTEEQLMESLTIYPNPSNGIIQIKTSTPFQLIVLYDLKGNLIETWKGSTTDAFSVTLPNKGIFFLKVIGKEEVITHKVVVY